MTPRTQGMTLVELMLALFLGSLIAATAIGVFLVNRQTLAITRGLGQIQQDMQIALELMARDLRRAGGNPCSRQIPLANLLHAPASRWWTHLASSQHPDGPWAAPWRNTLRGLTAGEFAPGSGAGARVADSDAIEILAVDARTVTVVSHDGAQFVLNTGAHGFSSGHLLLACDMRQASLFQAQVSAATITHPATGMNCSAHLGLPGGCQAEPYLYSAHALLARWHPVRWYLGHNGRGGTSLYQMRVEGDGQGVTRQEMVEHVTTLEFRYLLAGALEPVPLPGVGGQWEQVTSVQMTITTIAQGLDTGDGEPLTRTAVQTVNLRNRHP